MIADPRNAAITAGLVLSFAALVTLHVAALFGLVKKGKLGGAALGLLLPPIAPAWAWREGMRARAIGWMVAAVAYGVCLWLAR